MAKRKPLRGDKQTDDAKAIAVSLVKCQAAWADVPRKLARELIRGL